MVVVVVVVISGIVDPFRCTNCTFIEKIFNLEDSLGWALIFVLYVWNASLHFPNKCVSQTTQPNFVSRYYTHRQPKKECVLCLPVMHEPPELNDDLSWGNPERNGIQSLVTFIPEVFETVKFNNVVFCITILCSVLCWLQRFWRTSYFHLQVINIPACGIKLP